MDTSVLLQIKRHTLHITTVHTHVRSPCCLSILHRPDSIVILYSSTLPALNAGPLHPHPRTSVCPKSKTSSNETVACCGCLPRFLSPRSAHHLSTDEQKTLHVLLNVRYTARTTEATKRLAFRDELAESHAKCSEQQHRTFKWKRRVERETRFFNGRALTGQYQR